MHIVPQHELKQQRIPGPSSKEHAIKTSHLKSLQLADTQAVKRARWVLHCLCWNCIAGAVEESEGERKKTEEGEHVTICA